MESNIRLIPFDHRKRPNLAFDILRLENLLTRKNLDHQPTQLHRVDFYLLLLICSGQGHHTVDFHSYPLQRGSILSIRKNQIHRFEPGEAQGFILIFTHEFMHSHLEKLEALKTLQLFNELLGHPHIALEESDFEEIISLVNQLREEFDKPLDEFSPGILRSYLHVLISKLYRYKSRENLMVKDRQYLEGFIHLQQLVEAHCMKTRRVQDYAELMGYSAKTLNKITKSIINQSAKTFIDEILITQIKRTLMHTPWSVKEIAYKAGFEEPSNLYKFFKRYTQVTPEAFRQKLQ